MRHSWHSKSLMALILGLVLLPTGICEAAQSYVEVEFYAVRDTIRDTTEHEAVLAFLQLPQAEPMSFAIFAQPTGTGPALWSESHTSVPIAVGGRVEVLLGTQSAMSSTIFGEGLTRYLEVTIDGVLLGPRIALVTTEQVLVLTRGTAPCMAESDEVWTSNLDSEGAAAAGTEIVSSPGALLPLVVRTTAVFTDAADDPFNSGIIWRTSTPMLVRQCLEQRRFRALLSATNRLELPKPEAGPRNQ